MAQLFDIVRNDPDAEVRQLAMLSELAVFRDILPGYRIRLPTAAERAQKTTKEVRKIREYEAALMTAYQSYLKHLEAAVKTGAARYAEPHDRQTAVAAMTGLGQLLNSHPNFNFRSNVLKLVVERAGTPNPALRTACVNALRQLFKTDQQGEVALEAVTLVAKLVKEKRCVGQRPSQCPTP